MESKLKVKSESLPNRCDICHQSDLYDQQLGYCTRCQTQTKLQYKGIEKLKKCPYCAEEIKEEAIKCRYCGSSLSGISLWTKTHQMYFIGALMGLPLGIITTALITRLIFREIFDSFGRGGVFIFFLIWIINIFAFSAIGGLIGRLIEKIQGSKKTAN